MTRIKMSGRHHPAESPPVYIVDDDPSMGRSLCRLLTLSEWRPRTFVSAEAFFLELDRLSSGFLLIDIQLPGMSGLELLERLRDMQVLWPAIAMSGSNDVAVEREALRLGARMFLHKPFDPEVLLDALAQMVLSPDTIPIRSSLR
jgi:FixJ family two-component response regulator